jgi:hypothetical protein
MLRRLVLGLTLAVFTMMSSFATVSSAHAGPLTRVKNAVKADLEGDRRALHDLSCGRAKAAVRDVVDGARLGVTILNGGGGGFGGEKSC